ncbi:MAG: hypothetical protein HYX78_12605 [Armatimonadetes bacterium]|nr:hypothetical protein [Armatimonadota bacterium]
MRKVNLKVILLGLIPPLICFGAIGFHVFAQSQVPTAEFLAAGLRNQEIESGQSLEVKYTTTIVKDQTSPGEPTKKVMVDYIRTPSTIYIDRAVYKSTDGATGTPEFRRKVSYDRAKDEYRALQVIETGQTVSLKTGLPLIDLSTDSVETTWYMFDEERITKLVTAGQVVGQEEVDGALCYRVDVPEKCSVWIDPEIGFCPRRITRNSRQVDFKDYREIRSGAWFPMQLIVHTKFGPSDTPGELRSTVDEVYMDRPIAPEKLKIDL